MSSRLTHRRYGASLVWIDSTLNLAVWYTPDALLIIPFLLVLPSCLALFLYGVAVRLVRRDWE